MWLSARLLGLRTSRNDGLDVAYTVLYAHNISMRLSFSSVIRLDTRYHSNYYQADASRYKAAPRIKAKPEMGFGRALVSPQPLIVWLCRATYIALSSAELSSISAQESLLVLSNKYFAEITLLPDGRRREFCNGNRRAPSNAGIPPSFSS